MSQLVRSTTVMLFDEDGLKGLFDHVRNLLMATLIIAAGTYGLREAATIHLFGALDVELAGYAVIAIGVLLATLNAFNGLYQLNKQQWHIGLRLAAIALYFVATLRILQLLVALRNG
jgi:hypothetical protein